MKKVLYIFLFYSNILAAQNVFEHDIIPGKKIKDKEFKLRNRFDVNFQKSSENLIARTPFNENNNGQNAIADCPVNIGFEFGDFSFWQTNIGTVETMIVLNDTINNIDLPINTWLSGTNTPSPPQRQQLMDRNLGRFDYYGQFPVNPPNGRGGRYAVKLGSDEDAVGSNRPDKKTEAVRYIINVPTPANDFSITFSYAVVLENPDGSNGGNPHAKYEQPRFKALLYNATTGVAAPCASFDFIADSNLPEFFQSTHSYEHSRDASVQCKSWTDVFVNLDSYAGQTMYLEFTTADCTKGGHFGYAYVDVVECGLSTNAQYDCLTGNASFTAPPGFKHYEWYNNNYSLTLGNTQNITVSNALIDTNYWCIVTPYDVNGCVSCICIDTIGVKASVNYPVVDAGNSTSLCNKDSVQIGSSSITGYNYSWSPNMGLSDSTLANPMVSPNSNTQYILTVKENLTGCVAKDTIAINVKPSPKAGFVINDSTQCLNSNLFSFVDTSNISSGYYNQVWNFGDGNFSSANNPNHVYSSSGIFNVNLIISSDLNCADSIQVPVRVVKDPSTNFTINNNSQCFSSNQFSFQISQPESNTIYTWDFGDHSPLINSINPTHSYLIADSFLVQVLSDNNGCADTSSTTIHIYNKPVIDITTNGAPVICSGDSIVLNAIYSAVNGSVTGIVWYKNNTIIPGVATNSISVTNAGNYKAEIINSFGCNSADSIDVTEYSLPSGNLNAPSQNYICRDEQILITASGGNIYKWYLNGSLIPNQTNDSIYANIPGMYAVEVINAYGCKTIVQSIIELKKLEKPIADFTFNKNCVNSSIDFHNLSETINSGNILYTWNFTDFPESNAVNPSHVFSNTGYYLIKLTVQSTSCQNLSDSLVKVISIVANPTGIRYSDVNAVMNQPQQLTARNIGIDYLWQPPIALNNYRIIKPIFTNNRDVEYLIHIKDNNGCNIVDTLLVRIFGSGDIYVPNAFTPNGSGGANDHMYPILVGMINLKFFRIFDRWGKLVYESSQALPGWNGVYHGKPQPMDTYTWTLQAIDVNGKVITKAGNCVLIR